MKPARFDYYPARDLADALAVLSVTGKKHG